MTDYYILELWDPALPGFVSGGKYYIGTEEDMRNVAFEMEKADKYEETRNAIFAYLGGDHKATHHIAYQEIPILERATFVSEYKCSIKAPAWTHLNTWGFTYDLKANSALVSQIIVRRRNNYYRCLRVWFDNLKYESVTGKWDKLWDFFLGHGFLLDIAVKPYGNFTINNLLYVVEEIHKDRETAEMALTDPTKIDYKPFCDEIFADG